MDPDGRIAPLLRLLRPALQSDAGGAPVLGRRRMDPLRAWSGRMALDRARVAARPDDADAWWRLAMGLEATGRHEASAAAFLRALRRDLSGPAPSGPTTPAPARPGPMPPEPMPPVLATASPATPAPTVDPPPHRQALIVTSGRQDLDLALELAGALAEARLPIAWICTEPVAFASVRDALGPRGGRAYRLDPGVLGVFLRDTRLPIVGAAFGLDATDLAPLPASTPCVRLPRRWTEGPRPEDSRFDAVLCPTRPMSERWGPTETEATAVQWPQGATEPGTVVRPSPEIVLVVRTEPARAHAWTEEQWCALVRAVLVEMPEARMAVRVGRRRHAEFLRRWREEFGGDPRLHRRARLELADRGPVAGAAAIVVEPDEEAVAQALRTRSGPPILVHAPSERSRTWMGLPVADTPLRAVAALHAFARDYSRARRQRDAARGRCFHGPDTGSLPAVEVMGGWLEASRRPRSTM